MCIYISFWMSIWWNYLLCTRTNISRVIIIFGFFWFCIGYQFTGGKSIHSYIIYIYKYIHTFMFTYMYI